MPQNEITPKQRFDAFVIETIKTPKERLDSIQAKLIDLGIIDIKFTFNETVSDKHIDDVRLSMVRVLEAYYMKEYKPLPKIGDSNE